MALRGLDNFKDLLGIILIRSASTSRKDQHDHQFSADYK
jgi:hypothetical protein